MDINPPPRSLNIPGIQPLLDSLYTIFSQVLLSRDYAGKVTLASGTGAVTFKKNQPDTDYYICLAGDTAETFTWASKAVTGFTINSSNASSTAKVDWIARR